MQNENIFFVESRVPIEYFPCTTVVGTEPEIKIYIFFGVDRVPIEFLSCLHTLEVHL